MFFVVALEEILHVIMQKVYDEDDDEGNKMDTDEIDEETMKDDPSTILLNSSNQVQKLLLYLKQFAEQRKKPKGSLMKGLIFVKRRYTARILCHVVRRYMNSYPELNVNIDFMTGRNAFMPDSIESLMNNKNNNRVLDRFRRDEINLIIATSVLEEGIDLQECNLVVCFDAVETFRQYVQTKGRARMRNSKHVIMAPSADKNKTQKKLDEWAQINKILRNYLVEKAVDRPPPLQDDIDKAAEMEYNETFRTERGATVDYFSAISLVNRYCMSLPQDVFTIPAIQWSHKKDDVRPSWFIVSVLLPIQSPLKHEIRVSILYYTHNVFDYDFELIELDIFAGKIVAFIESSEAKCCFRNHQTIVSVW